MLIGGERSGGIMNRAREAEFEYQMPCISARERASAIDARYTVLVCREYDDDGDGPRACARARSHALVFDKKC